ncbi:beta-defensin 108B [Leptonychotes weddellii]|uniref:Beta-defensin 108B n=1 Tax=Leptonychotes weddellii TaxID=9713 RepID=A0A7F8R2D3_LEPWE|nr:beta-defensin 108B [Leptonychotes weddellii]
MKPGFLLPAARRPVALLFTILFFMSQALPARGRFKEVCERPNGDCQEFCLESERQAGICLNGQSCCLPMGNEPIIEPTTPKE